MMPSSVWVGEIRSRAEVRIGILSQDLEKAPPGPEPEDTSQRRDVIGKRATSGISKDQAHRYESLAGDPRARTEAARATDADFAETRAKKERPTFEGLLAVRRAAAEDADVILASCPRLERPTGSAPLWNQRRNASIADPNTESLNPDWAG
jgi:hypothetical protein